MSVTCRTLSTPRKSVVGMGSVTLYVSPFPEDYGLKTDISLLKTGVYVVGLGFEGMSNRKLSS